jgi:hypothetical protein
MGVEWTPVLIFGGFFLFLILRGYFRYKLHLAAVEKGQPLPETPRSKGDLRKQAIVLIALGLGYSISMFTTLSYVDDHDAPALAVSIWGIVPILIGAGLWFYWRMAELERRMEHHGPLP